MGQYLASLNEDSNDDTFEDCKKNPGHKDFITIQKCLSLHEDFRQKLPEAYHADIVKVKHLIENLSKLTVKIQANDSLGTGFIKKVKFFKKCGTEQVPFCRCDQCTTSSANEAIGKFSVQTAAHVLPQNVQVNDVSCVLFYDSEESQTITCRGHRLKYRDLASDTACIECLSCARHVLVELQSNIDNFRELSTTLQSKYHLKRNTEDLAVIIVSHLHGHFKHVTIGQSYDDDKLINNRTRNQALEEFFYDAATCVGSSGAYVYRLGGVTETLDITHRGVLKKYPGLNAGNAHKKLNNLSAKNFYKVSSTYLRYLISSLIQFCPGTTILYINSYLDNLNKP